MKSFRVIFTAVLLAGCFWLTLLALPASADPNKPAPPPDRRYLVKSVDTSNNSISIFSSIENTTKTYRIDDMTSVQVDGAAAKFADIKAGMEVATFMERDADDLDSVNLLSKTSAPVAADPAKPATIGSDNTIQAVNSDTNSVVILDAHTKLLHTYRIDAATTLKVNGVTGAFGDIKAGMTVKDFTERDNDDLDSLTVMGY